MKLLQAVTITEWAMVMMVIVLISRAVHAAFSWWLIFLIVADAWKDPYTSQQWLQY